MKKGSQHITNSKLAWNGAVISMACIFFYSHLVTLYVVFRSSSFIFSVMGKGQRAGILFANGFAIAYSVAVFSLIIAMISMVTGAVAALLLGNVLLTFNSSCKPAGAIIISFIVSGMLTASGYLIIDLFLIPDMASRYPEAFLFWIGVPSLIYVVANLVGALALNKSFLNGVK